MERNENAADPSLARYRLLVERSSDGIVLLNREGRFLEANPAACAMMGCAEAELIGVDFRQFVAEDERAESDQLRERLAAGMPTWSNRRVRRKDGTYLNAEVSAWPAPGGQFQAILRDVTGYKAAEQQLRANQERMATVIANVPLILAAVDRDGIFTFTAGSGLEKIGRVPGGSVGSSMIDVNADNPEVTDALQRALAGETVSAHIRIGDLIFETAFTPMHDHQGAIDGAVAVGIDITDRVRAQEQLRVNEARLQTVISNLPVVLAAVDRNGIFTLSDGKALAAVGMEPGQAVGMSIFDLYAGDSDNVEAAHRVLRGESFVIQINVGDGIFESHYEPIRDSEGNVTGAIAVGIDITERARALEEARRNRQYLQSVLASAPLIVGVVNRDGIFTLSEGKALAALGLNPGDAVGQSARVRYHDYPELLDAVRRAFQGESSVVSSAVSGISFENYISPLRDESGAITGAVSVGVDVTERKRLEEQFLQAQKMETIGRLAGGVAHDVNNLMTVIIGTTDLILDTLGRDHAAAADVREISEVAQRASTLAHQLLAFSRRQMIQPGVINLNDLVTNTERMLVRLIGEDIELRIVLAPDLGQVNVDMSQFQQLLVNLAVNSRDAMPDGGRLIIETENVILGAKDMAAYGDMQPGAYVMLTVSDTGTGMSEDVLPHVFEPFFTTKEVGHGTGLGLAAAYGIAKQAGGDISVQSESGRGTTFKVLLPRIDAAADAAARADLAAHDTLPRGTETILLVEDEAALRIVAARILTRLGYSVIEAADGAEALRVATTIPRRIDLLLTDVVMPSTGGRELGMQLARQRPSIRVLLTSGYADDAVLRLGTDPGDVGFLRKPFSSRILAEKVREVLDAPALDSTLRTGNAPIGG